MPTLKKAAKQINHSNKRKERQEIYNTTKWKKLRDVKLMESPLCEVCLAEDFVIPAIDVHHKDSFMNYDGMRRKEKAFDICNLQSICRNCHNKYHQKPHH